MPRTRTLTQLRTDARELADQENSGFISDAEATRYVNQSLAELWNMLVVLDADRYTVSTDVTTVSGTREYALPADFQSVRLVRRMESVGGSNERGYVIRHFPLAEIDDDMPAYYASGTGAVRYTIIGQGVDGSATRLLFSRDPEGRTYRVHYVQAPPELVNDADEFDGVAGWEEYIALDVAIKMLQKEESDPTVLMAQRQRVEDRIKSVAGVRDMSGTSGIPVTRRRRYRRLRAR